MSYQNYPVSHDGVREPKWPKFENSEIYKMTLSRRHVTRGNFDKACFIKHSISSYYLIGFKHMNWSRGGAGVKK